MASPMDRNPRGITFRGAFKGLVRGKMYPCRAFTHSKEHIRHVRFPLGPFIPIREAIAG